MIDLSIFSDVSLVDILLNRIGSINLLIKRIKEEITYNPICGCKRCSIIRKIKIHANIDFSIKYKEWVVESGVWEEKIWFLGITFYRFSLQGRKNSYRLKAKKGKRIKQVIKI